MTEPTAQKKNNHRSRCCITQKGFDKLREKLNKLKEAEKAEEPTNESTNYRQLILDDKTIPMNKDTIENMIGKHNFGQDTKKNPVQLRKIVELFQHYGLSVEKQDWDYVNDDEFKSQESQERDYDRHISKLVKDFRYQIEQQIKEICGKIKILTMSKPVAICCIYVDLKIIGENKPHRIKISEFEKEAQKDNLRILITAEIGGGKTTFLKNLAFNCIKEKF
ncbi:MAG: hypothetical protein RMY29_027770 [Nostoc sp. CreGUA01]|nr:hypothetical protein [Nostoc sp. CreGUA01]